MLQRSIFAIFKGILCIHLKYIGLFHATSQQNECISSSFLITLWPWMKVKIFNSKWTLIFLYTSTYQVWAKLVYKHLDALQCYKFFDAASETVFISQILLNLSQK